VDGIALSRPIATVTDADVDAMVANLREQRRASMRWIVSAATATASPWTSRARWTVRPSRASKGENVAVLLGGGRMLKEFGPASSA